MARYHDRLSRALASLINVLDPDVVVLEPRAGEPRFDAAVLPTVARRTGLLVGGGPGKRIVPPFARNEVRARETPAVHHDPSAHSRTEDHAEHHRRSRGRTVGRLG